MKHIAIQGQPGSFHHGVAVKYFDEDIELVCRETFAAVRKAWPAHLPLTARFGVLEYDGNDEQTLSESIQLVKAWRDDGLDMLSVSVGFTIPNVNIPWGPAFMGPIAFGAWLPELHATVFETSTLPVLSGLATLVKAVIHAWPDELRVEVEDKAG